MFRPRSIVMVVSALLSIAPAVAHASVQKVAGNCTVVTVIVYQHHPSVWVCPPGPEIP